MLYKCRNTQTRLPPLDDEQALMGERTECLLNAAAVLYNCITQKKEMYHFFPRSHVPHSGRVFSASVTVYGRV